MPATRTPTAERLTFRWWPSFSPEYKAEVEVREKVSGVHTKSTTYAVMEADPLPSGVQVFRVRKQGMGPQEWYEVRVYPRGHTCTCKGSVCRRQDIECRHLLAIQYLTTEGVF